MSAESSDPRSQQPAGAMPGEFLDTPENLPGDQPDGDAERPSPRRTDGERDDPAERATDS